MITIEKLEAFFKKRGIPSDKYSIYQGVKSNCIVLDKMGSLWKIFYVDERGGQYEIDYGGSEQEAFLKFFKIVIKDNQL
jgi:hypothetical protein